MFSLAVFILFWLMLLCNQAVAVIFGKRMERAFAAMLCAVSAFVLAAGMVVPAHEWTIVASATDWVILAMAVYLALTSDRHWPIWFAAMQFLAVTTAMVAQIVEETVPRLVFTNLAASWSLPALVTMSWGTIRDWQARQQSAF